MTTSLDLTSEEATTLRDAIQSYLQDFHSEIVHTEDYDFRQALQRKREVLEGILSRLGTS